MTKITSDKFIYCTSFSSELFSLCCDVYYGFMGTVWFPGTGLCPVGSFLRRLLWGDNKWWLPRYCGRAVDPLSISDVFALLFLSVRWRFVDVALVPGTLTLSILILLFWNGFGDLTLCFVLDVLGVLTPMITRAQVAIEEAPDRHDDLLSEVFGERLLEEFALTSLENRALSARGALGCKASLLRFFLLLIGAVRGEFFSGRRFPLQRTGWRCSLDDVSWISIYRRLGTENQDLSGSQRLELGEPFSV